MKENQRVIQREAAEGEEYGNGNGIDQINEVEKTKISLLRAKLEIQDPSSKELDDSTMRRFLRARELDVEKACTMLLKYLKWRRNFVPNGYISEAEVPNELAQKKLFMQGTDKNGRPIIVLFGAKHFQNKIGGIDEFKRFLVYALDKLCSRSSQGKGKDKFAVIGDVEGWGYCNSDIRAYLAALSTLQDYYPERLGKVFLIHVPYIFMTAWKIIFPFIDNNTKQKIVFVENKRLKATLLEDIDENQLPEIYGGKLPLVPIQDA